MASHTVLTLHYDLTSAEALVTQTYAVVRVTSSPYLRSWRLRQGTALLAASPCVSPLLGGLVLVLWPPRLSCFSKLQSLDFFFSCNNFETGMEPNQVLPVSVSNFIEEESCVIMKI